MSESRLKIVFAISLVILGVLAGLAVFRPLVTSPEFSAVGRESVLKTDGEWIIQFDIINQENKDMNYSIVFSGEGQSSTETVLVGNGRTYSHIHHVYMDPNQTAEETKVDMTIYEEGNATPFEQVTYHLN